MKKIWKFLIILSLLVLNCILGPISLETNIFRVIVIIIFNLFFYSLIFLIDFNYFKKIFTFIIIFEVILWIIFIYFINMPSSRYFRSFWEVVTFITFSIIAPGLTLYTIHYIKKITPKFENSKVFGKYHLHEGFIGILIIILALLLFLLHSFLLIFSNPLLRRLRIFLVLNQIFLFLFLYFGGFFIFRDLKDVIRLKLIEVKEQLPKDKSESIENSVFNQIRKEDLDFFKFPRLCTYPLGLILASISITIIVYVVYSTDFRWNNIIDVEREFMINLGFFLSFIAGAMTGRDWFRIFRRFYPDIYHEIEKILHSLV